MKLIKLIDEGEYRPAFYFPVMRSHTSMQIICVVFPLALTYLLYEIIRINVCTAIMDLYRSLELMKRYR